MIGLCGTSGYCVAYFCGKNRSTNTALLGDFQIGNLVSGSGPITFNYDINISTSFAVLNRMAVASINDTVSLMAIGQTDPNIDPNMNGADRLLYIKDYSTATGLLFESTNNTVFWDVVATNDYFAMTGTDQLSTSNLYLYTAPIGTSLSNFYPVFRKRNKYQCPRQFVSGIRATALNKDDIALASYYRDPSVVSCGLQVFTIDAVYRKMSHNQYYHCPYTTAATPIWSPKEMAFLPDSSFLMITDTILNASGDVSLLRLYAYPTYLPLGYYYGAPRFEVYNPASVVHYTSLSLLSTSSNYCLAVSGASWASFNMSTIVVPYSLTDCHNIYMADMMKDAPIGSSKELDGTTIYYTSGMKDYLGRIDPRDTDIQCSAHK